MTLQRRIILDVINSSCDHLTAEQIYMKAKDCLPSIALGTIYRNLGSLSESGEIMRISIPGEPDRYDRNPAPHFHAKCECCGKIIDVHLPDLTEQLSEQTGLDVTSFNINLRYICSDCKKK